MQFDLTKSVFGTEIRIPATAEVIFVSDMFIQDYVGGAELTTEALISSSPYEIFKIRSKDVTLELLRSAADRFWIFGNFAELNPQLLPSIIGNIRYSVLEYDYKMCRARSPEKHFAVLGTPCDCSAQQSGQMISTFYYGSMGMWWMSEAQKQRYFTAFPSLAEKPSTVLSSVFDPTTLSRIVQLREVHRDRSGWIVLGSSSWIKGAQAAEQWCKDTGRKYEIVWNLPYEQLLEKLACSEGFVYLPPGGDTCPRMVIEAKLLGCQLHLNDNVQHRHEPWFATDDLGSIAAHLAAAPGVFWAGIKRMLEYRPCISGYTTTYNCVQQEYPFVQSIKSMLQFCDEVCIVDGGSTDATFDKLVELAYGPRTQVCDIEDLKCLSHLGSQFDFPDSINGRSKDRRVKVRIIRRDRNMPGFAAFDGIQKAEARALCTKEFCWQMDSDEVVHEDDAPRIGAMCRVIPNEVDILALPVIEYWGSTEKIRVDVQPWKWRLSRNLPHITHGIPIDMRRTKPDGSSYAVPGTDGCDMIDAFSGERLQFVSFYPTEVEACRQAAMQGNSQALAQYQQWFNQVITGLPSVFHYSWLNLPRKMRLYRDYWQNHWNSLWDKDVSDTAENNMMFSTPWSQVTDDDISRKTTELMQIGGWIWHRPWHGEFTPWLTCVRQQPKVML